MTKTVKSYTEEGTKYQFDSKKMLMYVNQMKYDRQRLGKKKNQSHIKEELAEKLFVSEETVKSWMYGTNGPSDLEQVKQMADYFGVEYHQLLAKEEEEMAEKSVHSGFTGMASEMQVQLTRDRVREIYSAVLGCIRKVISYYYTEDTYEFDEHESQEYYEETKRAYTEANDACYKVENLLDDYLLDIPMDLYDRVHEYIWTDIRNMLEGIMSAYKSSEEELYESGLYDDLENKMDSFTRTGYLEDLRRIFADYIIK